VNTGGPASSFGIWHEYIDRVHEICARHGVRVSVLHTHIGSGADAEMWQEAARVSCAFLSRFPDVMTIDLGGGIKTPRMPQDKSTDIDAIIRVMREVIDACIAGDAGLQVSFSQTPLRVEIEPGTYLVAHCGGILCRVGDIVNTGKNGYTFLKLTTGMDAILRPALYGAQHHIVVIGRDEKSIRGGDDDSANQPALREYVVV
jgi:diaminopimelate decarboxylase